MTQRVRFVIAATGSCTSHFQFIVLNEYVKEIFAYFKVHNFDGSICMLSF